MKSVLTIGYGRKLFDGNNSERTRLAACASVVSALHMIVFSEKRHACAPAHDGRLSIYPTSSRARMLMLFDAYRIGSSILRTAGAGKEAHRNNWVISAQDPFEAGLVGYLLHLRYGIALQVQEHGDFFGGIWWRREQWINQIRYVFGKWLIRRADCVRAVSKRVAEHLALIGVDPFRITTLAVVSDLAAFAKRTPVESVRSLRTRYPIAEAIVLAVGRLVKEKNFPLLILAFKEVVVYHQSAQLVIVGSGPEKGALLELVTASGLSAHVSFIEWTDDVASYMRSADVFALSSYREGWGRVILEAMTAGLPSVVTDVGCVGEVFEDGRHGAVVPVDNKEALTKALRQLIFDVELRHRCGSAAARGSAAFVAKQNSYPRAWLATIEACGKVKKNYNR